MTLIWTLIIGLIVGAVAKLLMPGKDPGGIIITMLLGIAGAFVGTFIGQALWASPGWGFGWLYRIGHRRHHSPMDLPDVSHTKSYVGHIKVAKAVRSEPGTGGPR